VSGLAPPCRDYHMSMLRLAVTAKPAISATA
jgi:hypothetical protein